METPVQQGISGFREKGFTPASGELLPYDLSGLQRKAAELLGMAQYDGGTPSGKWLVVDI
jgi:hypothetical protein